MNNSSQPNLPPTQNNTPLTPVAHPSASPNDTKPSEPTVVLRPYTPNKKKLKKILITFVVTATLLVLATVIGIMILITQFTAQFDGLEEDMRRDAQTLQR